MNRLLNLLGIKSGKYSILVKEPDTHQGKLQPTELKQTAYRLKKMPKLITLVDADLSNDLRSTELLSYYMK